MDSNQIEVEKIEIKPVVKPVVVPIVETGKVADVTSVPERNLPTDAEISEKITPVFDEVTGDVTGTNNKYNLPTPLTPATNVTITPADSSLKDGEKPSFDVPSVINVVAGKPKEPIVYVVSDSSRPDTYICDCGDNLNPAIEVIEQPNDATKIIIDGEEVPVIQIGGLDKKPDVIHTIENKILIVDNSSTVPAISVVEVSEKPQPSLSPEQPIVDKKPEITISIGDVDIVLPSSNSEELDVIDVITPC